jgi:hypothetical protein
VNVDHEHLVGGRAQGPDIDASRTAAALYEPGDRSIGAGEDLGLVSQDG